MESIRRAREEKGLRQEDLAALMSVDRSTVAKWETGKSMPSAQKLKRLAAALNCTVDELLQ